MGTGNVPSPDDGHLFDESPDDPDATVRNPSVAGEPTQMIPVVPPADPPLGPGGPYGPGPAGPPPGPGDDGNRRRNLWLIVAAVLVVGIAIGAIVVWLAHSGKSETTSTTTTESSSSTSSTSSSSTSSTEATTSTTQESTTTTTAAPAVQVTSFQSTSTTPNCVTPAPDVSTSVPATVQQVTLNWSTTNATSVDISVDGPGVYQSNVGAAGSITIPYGCPGPHVYLLTAHGANGTAQTQQVSVTSTH